MFLGNETREKSGFVSYVSISLCFDFDPTGGPFSEIRNRGKGGERGGKEEGEKEKEEGRKRGKEKGGDSQLS